MAELTKREAEAVAAVKAAGKKGATFEALKAGLGIKGSSTLRGRIGKLKNAGHIIATMNGRIATYTAAPKK